MMNLFAGMAVVMSVSALAAPQLAVKERLVAPGVTGRSVALDVDRDGRVDLVAGGGWFRNEGDDRWSRHALPPRAVCLGDLDGDGFPDAVSFTLLDPPGSGARVVWHRNPGRTVAEAEAGVWKPVAEIHLPLPEAKDYSVQNSFVADLDRDGRPDIVLFGWKLRPGKESWKDQGKINNGWLGLVCQNADGTLAARLVDPSPGSHEGAALGDLDGDGDPDLVLNGAWLENPGDRTGEWQKRIIDTKWHTQIAPGDNFRPNAVQVALGDLDGDGRLDVVLCHAESEQRWPVSWYRADNPRRGPWTEHVIAYHTTCHTLQVADFDGDGRPDVLAASHRSGGVPTPPPYPAVVYRNAGGGAKWQPHLITNAGSYLGAVGDFNGDSTPDFASAVSWNTGPLRWFELRWRDTDVPPPPAPLVTALPLHRWHRVTLDDNMERAAISPNRNGNFFGLGASDLDGDGRPDVFAHRFWYRNPGGDLTAPWVRREFGFVTLDAFASADVNGNERADVLAQGDIGGGEVEVVWLEAEDRATTRWRQTVIGRVPKTWHGWHQWFGVAQIVSGGPPEVFVGEHYFVAPAAGPNAGPWTRLPMPAGALFGDVDGDGDLDLVGEAKLDGATHIVWWENDGGPVAQWPRHDVGVGISEKQADGQMKTDPDRIVLADLNADDRPDVLVGNEQFWKLQTEESPVYWFEAPKNPRTPGWRRTVLATVLGAQSLAAADLDHDGDLDIVLNEGRAGGGAGRKREMIIENHGGGVFSAPVAIDRGISAHNAAYLVDCDGDGDLDVVNESYFYPDVRYVWIQRNDAIAAAPARPPTVRFEAAEFEGRTQLRVATPGATWWLDTAAGGFSKLIDRDGRDWLAFSRTPLAEVPASAAAGFRGLPNMAFEGGAGHPGFDVAESAAAGPATVRARTKSGRADWTWTFADDGVRFRMERNESGQPWWFLYEGPIAGQWSPKTHYWATDRSDGVQREILSAKDQMVAPIQWVYFGDDHSPRVLFLAHLRPDDIVDDLWWMPSTKGGLADAANGMTVFGFGRERGTRPVLRGAGQEFLVGFVEDQATDAAAHQRIAAAIERRIAYALRETSPENRP